MPRTRKNPREKFLDAVNKILSKTDFQQLDRSCNGGEDSACAMEVLKKMHDAFTEAYGSDTLLEREYELVELPAVLQGKETKHIALGLVTVDLESAGELYGADFFTPRGALSYEDPDLNPKDRAYLKQLIGSYDYWYTPILERDSHAAKEPDRNKLYTKSSTTNSARPALNELQNLLTTSATAYIANFKVNSRIPYYVHHNFDRDMELFSRQLSVQVANTYDKWDSFGSFMDWLTLGIVSGIWRGMVYRREAMVEDPSLYNIVNALTAHHAKGYLPRQDRLCGKNRLRVLRRSLLRFVKRYYQVGGW